MTIRVPVYIGIFFAFEGHSTASLVILLSIMGDTVNDLPPLDFNPGRSGWPRECPFLRRNVRFIFPPSRFEA